MAKIQFSYSLEDAKLVDKLAYYLKEAGHNIFVAHSEILPGKILADEIFNNLKSTDFLIVVITENSLKSNWVMSELSQAMGYYKEKKRPIVIPIVFDEEPIPDILKTHLVIRASRENLKYIGAKITQDISRYIGELQAITDEKQESIARITENADNYIQESISRLEEREKKYRGIAYLCYFLCGISLIVAILFLFYKADQLLNTEQLLTISSQIQAGLLGIVLLALLISVSRFFFLIGKSFMVESLRNSDRIHAISFGKFYLKAFGEKADWNEIKEAFQHWNIDKGSTFISQNVNEFDPEIFKNIIEFTKLITNKTQK